MRTITYFIDEVFHPVRTGFHRVAHNHLAYLQARKYPFRLVLCLMPYEEELLPGFLEHYAGVDCRVLRPATEERDIFASFCQHRSPWTFDNICRSYQVLGQSKAVRRELREAEALFVSYAFKTPLLDLVPPTCISVNETVDLQARQFASMGGSEQMDERILAEELACYRRYQHLIMVSPTETQFLQERLPGVNVVYAPQFLEVEPCPTEVNEADYDILYLSSSHTSNLISVQEFYFNCYLPYLKHAGVRFALAGSVCDDFGIADHTVLKLGRVSDVRDTYARAKIVICPITRGAGVSIKTLEALSYGKAIVATKRAFSGLTIDPKDLIVTSDWRQFAEAVIWLKDSPKALVQQAELARELVARSHTRARYFEAMDRVFSSLG
jgi:hypothetical protein